MTNEIRETIAAITDANEDINLIYSLLDALEIPYKKTTCKKCRRDLLNILREEAGLIESAADNSEFNGETDTVNEWEYICNRPQSWNGYIIDGNTPSNIVREFVKAFPTGYYRKRQNNNTITND